MAASKSSISLIADADADPRLDLIQNFAKLREETRFRTMVLAIELERHHIEKPRAKQLMTDYQFLIDKCRECPAAVKCAEGFLRLLPNELRRFIFVDLQRIIGPQLELDERNLLGLFINEFLQTAHIVPNDLYLKLQWLLNIEREKPLPVIIIMDEVYRLRQSREIRELMLRRGLIWTKQKLNGVFGCDQLQKECADIKLKMTAEVPEASEGEPSAIQRLVALIQTQDEPEVKEKLDSAVFGNQFQKLATFKTIATDAASCPCGIDQQPHDDKEVLEISKGLQELMDLK